ncbi:MAG: polysaccharide pyruvyl transferase family protein, partial [Clostridia bacterium]|nr:polysaccharide pyruvyl transferase family protein [Clostridia bacterium]
FSAREPATYYEKKYKEQLKKCEHTEGKTAEEIEEEQETLERYKKKWDGYTALREERKIRFDKFEKFIDDNYKKTDVVYSARTFDDMDPGFDCYICVDDVIWSYDKGFGFDPGFLLDCRAMDGKGKIAYAASRGVPRELIPEQEEYFFKAVSDIGHIGVREWSLKKYIEKNLPGKRATVVLDAVLLLEAQDYEEFIVKPGEEGYVLLYYPMERPVSLFGFVEKYAKERGLTVIEVSHFPIPGGCMADFGVKSLYRYDMGPGEWLGYIKHAECVFTNSFHAICFSMLFHKNFFVGSRAGDKITNLLATFGLKGRVISVSPDRNEEIDYEPVDEILRRERKASADFILSAIQDVGKADGTEEELGSEGAMRQQEFLLVYRSMTERCGYMEPEVGEKISLHTLPSGYLEYMKGDAIAKNSGEEALLPGRFTRKNYRFRGWYIKAKVESRWYWVTREGSLVPAGDYDMKDNLDSILFSGGETVPYIPTPGIEKLAACAAWEKEKQ